MPGAYIEDSITITEPVELIGMPLGDKGVLIECLTESTIIVECDSVRIETMTLQYVGGGTYGTGLSLCCVLLCSRCSHL